MSVDFCGGIPITFTNTVKKRGCHHISFNKSSREYGCPTTALVINGRVFIILCGNHYDNLNNALADGIESAWDYVVKNAKNLHDMSEHNQVLGLETDLFGLRETTVDYLSDEALNNLYHAVTNNA